MRLRVSACEPERDERAEGHRPPPPMPRGRPHADRPCRAAACMAWPPRAATSRPVTTSSPGLSSPLRTSIEVPSVSPVTTGTRDGLAVAQHVDRPGLGRAADRAARGRAGPARRAARRPRRPRAAARPRRSARARPASAHRAAHRPPAPARAARGPAPPRRRAPRPAGRGRARRPAAARGPAPGPRAVRRRAAASRLGRAEAQRGRGDLEHVVVARHQHRDVRGHAGPQLQVRVLRADHGRVGHHVLLDDRLEAHLRDLALELVVRERVHREA